MTVKWGALLNDEWTFQGLTIQAGSAGQAYGNTIYIAEKKQPRSTSQLTLLAHEFVHVQQARKYGGLDGFCRKYMAEWANAHGVYDENSLEREAYSFDYRFASELSQKLQPFSSGYIHQTPSWNRRSQVVLLFELPILSAINNPTKH